MLKIGLTGGIGCGKTTVSKLFEQLNIQVIDADILAHQLVEIDQPALKEIALAFGTDMLNVDGSLNRKKLSQIIFSDSQQKQKLEAILHPLIYEAIQTALKSIDSAYCIISIPLLFETNMIDLVDRILVIDCPEQTQIERVLKRDAMPLAQIQAIIANQVSRTYRRSHAHDLIDTSIANDKLAESIKKLHNSYISLCANQDKIVCE
ncbi:MAG: dephospho-CoA kinase [Methylococcales bacterium]|nr:MAG: dephospho-CoA kinase [Methylococcales bacterium]